jgi:hypothetical protein
VWAWRWEWLFWQPFFIKVKADRDTITAVDIKKLLFLALYAWNAYGVCFFIPPKGWEVANPELLAPHVHICFLGTSSKGLAPSINLATEVVDTSLETYIQEVRKIHLSDPNSRWRDLGKYTSLLGEGRLTELETPTELGVARMVQLIMIKEGVAYILTASALKEEFSKYYRIFDQALHSLQSSSNLTESYPSKTEQLKKLVKSLSLQGAHSEQFQKNIWEPFEKKIIKDFTEMGPYWQILFLKEVRAEILKPRYQ